MKHYDEASFLQSSRWINDITEIQRGTKIKLSSSLRNLKPTTSRDKTQKCLLVQNVLKVYRQFDGRVKPKIISIDYKPKTLSIFFDNSEIVLPLEGAHIALAPFTPYKLRKNRFIKDSSKPKDGDTILREYCVTNEENIIIAGVVEEFDMIEDKTYALSLMRSPPSWHDVTETNPFKRAKKIFNNLYNAAIGGNIRPIITNNPLSNIKGPKGKSVWLLAIIAFIFEIVAFKILFALTSHEI